MFVAASDDRCAGPHAECKCARQSLQLGRVLELTNIGEATRSRRDRRGAAVTLPRGASRRCVVHIQPARTTTRHSGVAWRARRRRSPRSRAIRAIYRDSWGPSDTDFRHKVVVDWLAAVGYGDSRVGGRYVGTNGRPFSAIVNGDINGDEATSNDLAFVFDPDDPSTPPAIADGDAKCARQPAATSRATICATNLGRIASRNGAVAPVDRARRRASRPKTVRTARGQSARASVLDVFNVGEPAQLTTGAPSISCRSGISNQNPVVQRASVAQRRRLQSDDEAVHSTRSTRISACCKRAGNPYQIQLSVRYGL